MEGTEEGEAGPAAVVRGDGEDAAALAEVVDADGAGTVGTRNGGGEEDIGLVETAPVVGLEAGGGGESIAFDPKDDDDAMVVAPFGVAEEGGVETGASAGASASTQERRVWATPQWIRCSAQSSFTDSCVSTTTIAPTRRAQTRSDRGGERQAEGEETTGEHERGVGAWRRSSDCSTDASEVWL